MRLRKFLEGIAVYVGPMMIALLLCVPVGFLSGLGTSEMGKITLMLMGQNASFTLVSRARQSANLKLHALFALGSNGFFIFVITAIAAHYDNLPLKLWYMLVTTVGSLQGHYISFHKIEKHKAFQKDSLVTRAEHERDLQALRAELQEQRSPILQGGLYASTIPTPGN